MKNLKKEIFQEKKWKGKFGADYTFRNPQTPKAMDKLFIQNYGISRTKLNKEFLGETDRSLKILEVGSNVGIQLVLLQKMGFNNLYGIEINKEAIRLSLSYKKY